MVRITECPRDAMQGLHDFIPTRIKASYINQLLKVGFDTIDFGSFVSPKAIPQLKDTAEVLSLLDLSKTNSKLLAIVANERGAADAVNFEEINYLGFPFSISETFQQRNTNSSIQESLKRVELIQNKAVKHSKELVVYISMAFGNPYGDLWHPDIVSRWTDKLVEMGIKNIALSDTIGVSAPDNIASLFSQIIKDFSKTEIGAHLHTTPITWEEKVKTAYDNGCRKFDGAIKGFGGCPMAADELTGNMPTEKMVSYFDQHKISTHLDMEEFSKAMQESSRVFLT